MLRFVRLTQQVVRPLWSTSALSQPLRVPSHLQPQQQPPQQLSRRWYSDGAELLTDGEKLLTEKLKKSFPNLVSLEVSDISGGCGAMYQISIEAHEFIGKKTVQQHRLVNEALAEEIKQMHGLQLNTKAPS